MAEPTPRIFRIRGAEVVTSSPLVVRQRASDRVLFRIDDRKAAPLAPGQILLWSTAAPGPVEWSGTLPELGVDLGTELIEFVFAGSAKARVEGEDLVIETTSTVLLAAGDNFVPFTRAEVEAASIYAIETDGGAPPHQPKRQP